MREFMLSEDLEVVGANMFMGHSGDMGPRFTAYKFLQFSIPEVDVCKQFYPSTEIRNDRVFCPEDADLIKEARRGMSSASSIRTGPWMLLTTLAIILYCTM